MPDPNATSQFGAGPGQLIAAKCLEPPNPILPSNPKPGRTEEHPRGVEYEILKECNVLYEGKNAPNRLFPRGLGATPAIRAIGCRRFAQSARLDVGNLFPSEKVRLPITRIDPALSNTCPAIWECNRIK